MPNEQPTPEQFLQALGDRCREAYLEAEALTEDGTSHLPTWEGWPAIAQAVIQAYVTALGPGVFLPIIYREGGALITLTDIAATPPVTMSQAVRTPTGETAQIYLNQAAGMLIDPATQQPVMSMDVVISGNGKEHHHTFYPFHIVQAIISSRMQQAATPIDEQPNQSPQNGVA